MSSLTWWIHSIIGFTVSMYILDIYDKKYPLAPDEQKRIDQLTKKIGDWLFFWI